MSLFKVINIGMNPVADQSLSKIANLFSGAVAFLFGKYEADIEATARVKLKI